MLRLVGFRFLNFRNIIIIDITYKIAENLIGDTENPVSWVNVNNIDVSINSTEKLTHIRRMTIIVLYCIVAL